MKKTMVLRSVASCLKDDGELRNLERRGESRMSKIPKGEKNELLRYYYPIEKEKQLINFIKSRNRTETARLIDEIFENNSNNEHMSSLCFTCFKYEIVGTFVKVICDIFKNNSSEIINEITPVERVESCVDVTKLKRITEDVLGDVFDRMEQKYERSSISVADVINYVENNYTSENLSVSKVCDHFGVHLSYLSVVFKKQFGIGLSEYIRSVRVDKAKVLLKETNKAINAVSKNVGCASSHTFTRIFKNSEGLTPSVFRESQKM